MFPRPWGEATAVSSALWVWLWPPPVDLTNMEDGSSRRMQKTAEKKPSPRVQGSRKQLEWLSSSMGFRSTFTLWISLWHDRVTVLVTPNCSNKILPEKEERFILVHDFSSWFFCVYVCVYVCTCVHTYMCMVDRNIYKGFEYFLSKEWSQECNLCNAVLESPLPFCLSKGPAEYL